MTTFNAYQANDLRDALGVARLAAERDFDGFVAMVGSMTEYDTARLLWTSGLLHARSMRFLALIDSGGTSVEIDWARWLDDITSRETGDPAGAQSITHPPEGE